MISKALEIKTDNGLNDNNPSFHNLWITDYSYSSPRMGMPKLTATLKCKTCLDSLWTNKEYVDFNEERFYIRHTPSSSKDNTDVYIHNLEFMPERNEILANVYFYDAVYAYANTIDKPCSNSTKFTFFGPLAEFVDRLNCSFEYRGIGDSILKSKTDLTTDDAPHDDGYCAMVAVGSDYDFDVVKELSFENVSMWDAITQAYEAFEVPFEVRGKKIIFGAIPKVVSHKFEYGPDNELLSVEKQNANAKVINNITMLGSSENIPYYYPNESEYGHITLAAIASNTKLTASMMQIVNQRQLLARMNADSIAVLRKYSSNPATENAISPNSVEYAFGDSTFKSLPLGNSTIRHESTGTTASVLMHFRVKIVLNNSVGNYNFNKFNGAVWQLNQSMSLSQSLMGGVILENFYNQSTPGKSLLSQIEQTQYWMRLGKLNAGTYILQFAIPIPNVGNGYRVPITSFIRIDSIGFSRSEDYGGSGYYWEVGEKRYKGVESLGIKITAPLDDSFIGEGFKWTAEPRINFQDRLMPPKYRSTNGDDRFYPAANNTYKDPDTNEFYAFANPYKKDAPCEHIYENEDIKPTIEGVTNSEGKLIGQIVDVAFDTNDNDSLKPDSESTQEDADTKEYEHSFFYLKLNIFDGDFGFNLFDHAGQTDPMTIQMTSGPCNGCKFKIQTVEKTEDSGLVTYGNPVQTYDVEGDIVDGDYDKKIDKDNLQTWQQDTEAHSIWICVQKDVETFGIIMPNAKNNYKPGIGDTFNIINIELPNQYITAAEKRLEEEGLRYMADNNEEKFTFNMSVSRIFLQNNPSVLGQMDEYAKVKLVYDGKEYELYVTEFNINVTHNEALADVQVKLSDTLAVGESFASRVAENASSIIANAYSLGKTGDDGNIPNPERRYINKTRDDRTPYMLSSDMGFQIGEFVSGGSGGIFYIDQSTGKSYIEVDELKVRMKAIFEELQISKISAVNGKVLVSPGGAINISYVEELDVAYRCYFKAKEETEGAKCSFVVGDLAQCREYNIQTGETNTNATNRYYWRQVVSVNNDESYVDLSKSSYDKSSNSTPQAGDTICQLGNISDKSRQCAIVISTVDAYCPSITLYNGIDYNFSLRNREIIQYGLDTSKTPPEPFFNCYGRFFFGPKNKSSYLQFEPSEGSLVFKGKLDLQSSVGDKSITQFVKDNATDNPYSLSSLPDYILKSPDGTLSPDSFIVRKYQNNDGTKVLTTIGFLRVRENDKPALVIADDTQDEGEFYINSDAYSIVLEWYEDDEYTNLILKESIPVIEDLSELEIGSSNLVRYSNGPYVTQLNSGTAQSNLYSVYLTKCRIDGLESGVDYIIRAKSTGTFTSSPLSSLANGNVVLFAVTYNGEWVRLSDAGTSGSGTSFKWNKTANNDNVTLGIRSYGRSVEVSEIMIVKGNKIVSEWSPSPMDVDYIKESLAQNTTIDGGLILTSRIEVGTEDESGVRTTMAGLNGVIDPDSDGQDIMLWAGGNSKDAEQGEADPATFIVRADGTGYMAGNTIKFKKDRILVGKYGQIGLTENGLFLYDSSGEARLQVSNTEVPIDEELLSNPSLDISHSETYVGQVANAVPYCAVYIPDIDLGTFSGQREVKLRIDLAIHFNADMIVTENNSPELKLSIGSQQRTIKPLSYGPSLYFDSTATFNVSAGKAILKVQIINHQGGSPEGFTTANIPLSISGYATSVLPEQTILATNGFVTTWHKSELSVTEDFFIAKIGKYAVRITDEDGIQKWDGTKWSNL